VQSFNNEHLKSLGRIHSADNAIYACEQAKQVGFDNFNIDLMYGLQNQTIDGCLSDLKRAIELNPTHISFYQLTIEPNTLFAKFPPILPKADDIWSMGEQGIKLLNQQGFERYEVSAFGRVSSKHNVNYWEFGDYIGIGAGAHGKITNIKTGKIFRTMKPKSPKDYLGDGKKTIEIVDNLSFEFMLNALRLKNGFKADLFMTRTGQSVDCIKSKLERAQSIGLLEDNMSVIIPTKKGFDFLNDLQALFL